MVASKPKPSGNKKKPSKLKQQLDELHRTICCCLCVDEATRKFLWEAMEKYTLLVNLLLEQVGHAPELEQWKLKGSVPKDAVEALCTVLKQKEQFKGLPSRFYMSAETMVRNTFEGWVKLQQRISRKINGKKRWLKSIEEDIELAKITDFSPETIQNRAREILLELLQQQNPEPQTESSEDSLDEGQPESKVANNNRLSFSLLFDTYEVMEDNLSRRAIVHLLKNEGKVNEEAEDPEKLARRLATKRRVIQRLETQLESRLPKGRDPTGEQAIEFLQEAIQYPEHPNCYPALFLFDVFYHYALLPISYVQYAVYLLQTIAIEAKIVESEFLSWHEATTERLTNAAKIPNSSLYPVIFGSTDDLYWSFESKKRNQQDSESGKLSEGAKSRKRPSKRKRKKLKTQSEERICVRFKGLSDYVFKIYCDRRQLPMFRLFATDWVTYKEELDKERRCSLGLFALRSAKLIWKEDKQLLHKKGKSKQASSDNVNASSEQEHIPPWKTHRLYLHCSVDPDLLTAEGTEKVQLRKIAATKKTLDNARKKEQEILAQISGGDLTEQKKQELEDELTERRRKILGYETSLIQLNNSPLRPSKVPHQGEANITLGISFCRQELVGAAVVDLQTQQVLEYYSDRKLLINQRVKKARRNRTLLQLKLEKYRLVNRLRKLSRHNLIHRQKEQRQGQCVESGAESNLGQYLEQLIATRIVQVALKWKASSIVIPDLEDAREYIESAVQIRAEKLFPNQREQQKNYAKQFRIDGHRWSYGMLTEFIRSRALSEGISVKTGRQPVTGDLVNKALKIALSGHNLA